LKIVFRVNNPEFGILHLMKGDPSNSNLGDAVRQAPIVTMLPECCDMKLFARFGLRKGDPIHIEFDTDWEIVSIERMDGGSVWRK